MLLPFFFYVSEIILHSSCKFFVIGFKFFYVASNSNSIWLSLRRTLVLSKSIELFLSCLTCFGIFWFQNKILKQVQDDILNCSIANKALKCPPEVEQQLSKPACRQGCERRLKKKSFTTSSPALENNVLLQSLESSKFTDCPASKG